MRLEEKVQLSHIVKTTTAITIVTSTIGGIMALYYALMYYQEEDLRTLIIGIMVFIALVFLVTYAFAPKRIILSDTQLILQRNIGTIAISYSDIKYVSIYFREKKMIRIRLFGSEGLWGYMGYYYNKALGRHIAYVGDYSQAFVVTLKSGKRYLLSCHDHERIVEAIKAKSVKEV